MTAFHAWSFGDLSTGLHLDTMPHAEKHARETQGLADVDQMLCRDCHEPRKGLWTAAGALDSAHTRQGQLRVGVQLDSGYCRASGRGGRSSYV